MSPPVALADSAVSSPFPQSPKTESPLANGAPTCFLSDRAKATQIDGIRGLLPFETEGVVSFRRQAQPHDAPVGGGDIPPAITIDGEDLDAALQYGPSAGLNKIRKWLGDLQEHVHKRAPGNWTISMGSGSQDLMSKGFAALLNPGDPILVETPVYSGVLPALRQLRAECIEVGVDDEGLSAVKLEEVLANWPADKKRPRVIYSTPVGCNPSGCSASAQRKRDVLQVMKKYDLLMMEDDPYYFLTVDLIPSYFELEPEVFPNGGHVIRFDSFSKLLSAGLRLGYATGPKDILHAIDVQHAGSNLHTSSLSQATALRLLQHWGIDGFLNHATNVAKFYRERRDLFEAAAHKYLDGLATWVSPIAGMFLWIDLSPAGVTDSYSLIRNEALAKGVLAVPGQAFFPSGRTSTHVRVSFSIVDLEKEAPLGLQRLAEAVKDKQKELGIKA
ncbi:hypothetical protein Q8F55_007098 [Vanrija albida]|uniref:Aminotransferase class I/classII large domain-containing protein n=1 Tax=Vanrija albida TaxID=181172 RepID=A0ABR3PYZ3_9TREE